MADTAILLDGVFGGIDLASVETILQLQLEDLQEIEHARPGKRKAEDDLGDAEMAFAIMADELRLYQHHMADRRMAQSIADAVNADSEHIRQHAQEERQLCEDNAYARNLIGQQPQPVANELLDDDDRDVAAAIDRLAVYNQVETEEMGPAHQGQKQCVFCLEHKHSREILAVQCGDEYCQTCLVALFEKSFIDESLFPPRCCRQVIDPDRTRAFLTQHHKIQYEEKMVEFNTVDRTYCSNQTCSKFIRPGNMEADVATCPDCSTRTCTMCKGQSHGLADCPNDTATAALNEMAAQQGWRRCGACRRMVELGRGCNHITCICRHEFCYECGQRWKTCTCRVFDEQRLLDQADREVAQEIPPAAPVEAQARAVLVRAAAQQIVRRHECAHNGWTRVNTGGRCDNCDASHRWFMFACDDCVVEFCATCRFNRA